MALRYSTDTNLVRQIKQISAKATNTSSPMTDSQKSILFMSALGAAGNIHHDGLRLATIKWVQARAARISSSPNPSKD